MLGSRKFRQRGPGNVVFLSHQRISQRAVQTLLLEKHLCPMCTITSGEVSVLEFLRKPIFLHGNSLREAV